MKFEELQSQINARANEVKTNYKYDFKSTLVNLINKILEENGLTEAQATYDFSEKSNIVKIIPRGRYSGEYFWAIYIEYKTSRKLLKERFYGSNDYEYTLKSVEIYGGGKREIGKGEEAEINTVELYLLAEEYAMEKKKNQANDEKTKLKMFMQENPDFLEMVKLYNKYQYNLA